MPVAAPLPQAWLSGALGRLLLAAGLGAARSLPITWLVPAWGGPRAATPLRVGLGLLLALLGLPRLLAGLDAAGLSAAGPVSWALLVAREVLIGATVGLVAAMVFRAAEAAGCVADLVRGANAADLLAPGGGERASPLGDLYLFLATFIFLELGGLGRLASALARSYDAIPIGLGGGAGLTPAGAGLAQAAGLVTLASARLIESALGLAAPVVVALLLADLALGAVARVAPRLPLHFAALPLKALLGVGVVLIGLGALDAALVRGVAGWLELAERGFSIWRH